jgi:hypothetical protein
VQGPVNKTRHTIKYIAVTLIATFVAVNVLMNIYPGNMYGFRGLAASVWVLSITGYWISIAWWVYLDATWRRMDAVPWGILTLLTNVIGLATYLVIRYPDPRSCPMCGAELSTGLKRCPYCGTETEPVCPQCQSQVQPDWIYCPSCSAKLPTLEAKPETPAMISITGSVLDSKTGAPIAGAVVGIDSKVSNTTTTTDDFGRFVLSNLQPRPWVIIASAEGYVPQAKPFSLHKTGPACFVLLPNDTTDAMQY